MDEDKKPRSDIGHYLFLLYTISFFFRLPERIPILGKMRFDFVLGVCLLVLAFLSMGRREVEQKELKIDTTKLLTLLLGYIVITIPMASWPGTVLKNGIPLFLKCSAFYIFVLSFIKNETQLRRFINIYLILALIIIIEPLIYYVIEGRMGYIDYSMSDDGSLEFARLTGVTDLVGGDPNSLGKAVAITFPFLFFLYRYHKKKMIKIALIASIPACMTTLVLTGSRSAILALAMAVAICLIKSRFLVRGAVVTMIIISVAWIQLTDIQKQRYLSIFDSSAKGRAGAIGRLEHIKKSAQIFTEKPFFGHGLGTFIEANWKYNREWLVSHSLYTGVLVELGIFGFLIYFLFIFSIFKNLSGVKRTREENDENRDYCLVISDILQTVLITQLVFCIFAGGPIAYSWFLFAGLSVSIYRIVGKNYDSAYEYHRPLRLISKEA